MSKVNLEYYKIFYEVAKQKNITHASEKLFISQPAVTQTIAKLEQGLGEKLFIRNNKGLTLTHLGEQIFEQVEQALQHFDIIDNIVYECKNLIEGTIKIGAGTNIAKEVLPNLIADFTANYPHVKFVLVDEHRKLLFEQLVSGEVDIAITQKENVPKHISYKKLLTENSVFFCNKNFDVEPFLTKKELAKQPLIVAVQGTTSRMAVSKAFTQNNLTLLPKFEVSGHNMILELVRKNLGVGILPQYLIENELGTAFKLIKTNIIIPDNEYGYSTYKQNLSPATKEFLKYLNKYAKKMTV